jgi:hypothetical protein
MEGASTYDRDLGLYTVKRNFSRLLQTAPKDLKVSRLRWALKYLTNRSERDGCLDLSQRTDLMNVDPKAATNYWAVAKSDQRVLTSDVPKRKQEIRKPKSSSGSPAINPCRGRRAVGPGRLWRVPTEPRRRFLWRRPQKRLNRVHPAGTHQPWQHDDLRVEYRTNDPRSIQGRSRGFEQTSISRTTAIRATCPDNSSCPRNLFALSRRRRNRERRHARHNHHHNPRCRCEPPALKHLRRLRRA